MVRFGVNINNREPLLREGYPPDAMLELSERAETLGYDSVWVGDGLLDRPRLEPLTLLGTLAGRTDRVDLGTACLLTPLRNPIRLAQAWNTLDLMTGGRMVMGACMGPPTKRCREQYEVVGKPSKRRAQILEEQLEILKTFWRDGRVTYEGEIFEFEDVSFYTGTETRELAPVQADPPILVVSNPSIHRTHDDEVYNRAARRIVDLGDGWLASGMSDDPETYAEQWKTIKSYAQDHGVDPADVRRAFQVTLTISDDSAAAEHAMREYIHSYYPHLSAEIDLDDWGPSGDSSDIAEWIESFRERGCQTFIVRFAGENPFEQLETFADEVIPQFQ